MTGFAAIPSDVRRLLAAHGLSATAMGLPWPALLVAVWEHSHDSAALGIAGAARMAPYVALSWLAGRLADRFARRLMVKASLALRVALLTATAVFLANGHVTAAVVCASLVVAAGTPAYPALAADMPNLARQSNESATGLLVTIEVAAFFVGPALGGVVLSMDLPLASAWAAVALTAAALFLVLGVAWLQDSNPPTASAHQSPKSGLLQLLRQRIALAALAAVVVNNAVLGAVGIALLPLAREQWHGDAREFGLATAALGLGAFAAPVLLKLWGLGCLAGRRSALMLGAFLAALLAGPQLWWAMLALAVTGAAAVHVEAVATASLQTATPDRDRSSVLGLADSLMVAAGAAGAAVTPRLAELWGPSLVIAGCAICSLGMTALFPRPGQVEIGAGTSGTVRGDHVPMPALPSDR
jgi:MFS family permease